MFFKRDVYRLYRMLSAVRRSLHLQSVDEALKLRHESHVREFLHNMLEVQNLSNTLLELFIFTTSLLVAILQLIQSMFTTRPIIPTVICIILYGIFIAFASIWYSRKRKKLSKHITEKEGQIWQEIISLEKQLHISGLRDDIVAALSELKLISELREEYERMSNEGKILPDEFQYEMESMGEAYKGVEERIQRMKTELKTALEEDK